MSIWSWWWNNVGAGGIEKGAKKGFKAGEDIVPGPNPQDLIGGASGAINDVKDGINLSKVIWLNVSDFRMWRSLGWLLLGVFMLILGFVVWNRRSIQAATGAAAKLAVL